MWGCGRAEARSHPHHAQASLPVLQRLNGTNQSFPIASQGRARTEGVRHLAPCLCSGQLGLSGVSLLSGCSPSTGPVLTAAPVARHSPVG